MLHVLIGNATTDRQSLFNAAKSGKPVDWIVPKASHAGGQVIFYLRSDGFIARGTIESEPKPIGSSRYISVIREINLLSSFVPLSFVRNNYAEWKWSIYPKMYTTIDGDRELRLNDLIDHYQASITGYTKTLTEGTASSVMAAIYERNPIARRECINHYGSACCICNFSFGEAYGKDAEGFIHVHHLKTISKKGGAYVVDPVKDLRPVCPNCHAIIHLKNPPLSIREVKKMLADKI